MSSLDNKIFLLYLVGLLLVVRILRVFQAYLFAWVSKIKLGIGPTIRTILLMVFLSSSVATSYAGNKYSTRPTNEAIVEDLAYCAPMYALALSLYVLYRVQLTFMQKVAVATGLFASYGVSRAMTEGWAEEFRDNSQVLNHSDFNNDLYNDYAKWVNLDYINHPTQYADYLGYDELEMRKRNISLCSSLVGKRITRTADTGFVYYDITLTTDDVRNLDGCTYCSAGLAQDSCSDGLYGFTYELYNQEYLCDGGVLVWHDGDEECIMKGSCKRMGNSSLDAGNLVCAYEMDALVCAESVFCSFTFFDSDGAGADESSDVQLDADAFKEIGDFFTGFAFDFSSIDGRVHNGVDPRDAGFPAIKTCQELVDSEAEECRCTKEQASESKCDYDAWYTCSRDNIDTVGTCEFCGDINECIDSDGIFDSGCAVKEDTICGYFLNDAYMRHCALDERIDIEAIYELPDFISKYCTGDAIVDTGNMSLAGRTLRCVELSIQNMFFGAYEVADGTNITDIYCINDDVSVNMRSECQSGIFVQFQDHMHDAIVALMALAISFLGVMILFGLMPDVKGILSYVLTIGFVFYFSLSDGWRDGYYDAVVTMGRAIGLTIITDLNYEALSGVPLSDGCDFTITSTSDDKFLATGPNDYVYPDNEAHYALWDLYDCKMQKFFTSMNYAVPFSSFQDLLTTLLPFGFIVAMMTGVVLYLFIFIFLFFTVQFLVFSMTAFFVITLLVFISPIVIPLILLKNVKKARAIYDAWFKSLIGYSFQPIIIYIIISILLVLIDYALYGDAKDMFEYTDVAKKEVYESDEIKRGCDPGYIPCIFHRIDIGYYAVSAKAKGLGLFSELSDMSLLTSTTFAFMRAIFFISITFFLAMTAMTILAASLFDAADNADVGAELMGFMSSAAGASKIAAMKGATGLYNTTKSAKSAAAKHLGIGRGTGSSGQYFK